MRPAFLAGSRIQTAGLLVGRSFRPSGGIDPAAWPKRGLPATSVLLAWADPSGPAGGIYPAGLAQACGRMLALEIDVSQVYVFLGVGACVHPAWLCSIWVSLGQFGSRRPGRWPVHWPAPY